LKISGGKTPSRADYELIEANAERAQAELHTAQASVDEANAQLKTHEIRLAKAVIKSPVDGIVLTRKVEPGQTVVASFQAPELFVIARDLKKMKVTVAVAEADIGRVKKDNKVRFTVDTWPTRHYDASVTKVSYGATIANNVVTYDTELNVNNSDLSLRPGMTAVADIEVDEHPSVLVVPTMALRYDPSRSEAPVAPKKGILENLLPGPRRRTERRASDLANASRPRVLEDGTAQLWILRKGQPVPVTVRVGLSNGRYTEVAGDEITEGIEVIIR
jgi:HlyD family secretion protein